MASYRLAIASRPGYADGWCNLGSALRAVGDYPGAIESYAQALALNPGFAKAHYNLGHVLQTLGRLDDAGQCYRRALQAQPHYPEAYSSLLFSTLHNGKLLAAEILAEHVRFGEQYEAPWRDHWPLHGNNRDPERRLRVGFVSGDLFQHPVAHFVASVWQALDRQQFQLHVYAQQVQWDSFSEDLRQLADAWTNVQPMDDATLAARIQADGIDILIDISGHTAHNRLCMFARKPAPVQASWIGYPGSTGLRAVDYYLFNGFAAPAGLLDGQFVEALVRLPSPSPLMPPAGSPDVAPLPALARGYVTFGSFNRPSKLGPETLSLWSQVLLAVPESRLLLGHIDDQGLRDEISARLSALGINGERVQFLSHLPMLDYLAAHAQLDIVLDSTPYTGGATSRLALWMGVPVLTLFGPSLPQRQGLGLNAAIGLPDWAAADTQAFVQKARDMAADLPALAALRAGMRARLAASPLMHPQQRARGVELALRGMWRRWCAGLPPAAFAVNGSDLPPDHDQH